MARRALVLVVVVAAFAVVAVMIWSAWPGRVKHVQEGCPGLVVGRHGSVDRSSSVRWEGRTYVSAGERGRLGAQVTTIRCSVTDIEGSSGLLAEDGPWPDRTASLLSAGTTVHEVEGHSPNCRLGAVRSDWVEIYVAQDEETGAPLRGC